MYLADYFKGDDPNIEKLHKGDFADFMEWRGRHGDEGVVGDTEKVPLSRHSCEHSCTPLQCCLGRLLDQRPTACR